MRIERSVGEQRKLDRFGNCESARINYVASSVENDQVDAAVTAVFEAAPEYWEGIPKTSAEILRSPGGGMWEIGVSYKKQTGSSHSGRSAGDKTWKIDVVSRNQPIRRALKCLCSKSAINGVPAPDPGTRLEWNGIGRLTLCRLSVVYKFIERNVKKFRDHYKYGYIGKAFTTLVF